MACYPVLGLVCTLNDLIGPGKVNMLEGRLALINDCNKLLFHQTNASLPLLILLEQLGYVGKVGLTCILLEARQVDGICTDQGL